MKQYFDYILYAASVVFFLGLIGAALYFYPYPAVIALLLSTIVFLGWQVYKFARLVMLFEDDLGEALDALQESKDAINGILEMKMFFDSEDIKRLVTEQMDTVRLAESKLNQTIKKFVDRSKQKYIIVIEEENRDLEQNQPSSIVPPRPNPQSQEGTIAHVERPGRI